MHRPSFPRRSTYSLCLLLVAIFAGWEPGAAAAQSFERTVQDTVAFDVEGVSVENEEGSITLSTWDRDAVGYRVRIVSDQSERVVDQTAIDVDRFNQRLSLGSNLENIEAEWSFGPDIFGYGVSYPEVHYRIAVPETASVTIDDHESDIEVTGLAAALQVDTHEGAVEVTDQEGTVRLDSHEGDLSVTGIDGDLKVDTHEGALTASGLRGRLFLETHEGGAEVAFDSLATTTVDTHEGDVTLTMPSDRGFEIDAELDGDVVLESDYPLDALRTEEDTYQGSVLGGGPLLRLTSSEGTIRLRRR